MSHEHDMSDTRILFRCAICGRWVDEDKAIKEGWRVTTTDDGPMWACDKEWQANAAETESRLQTLATPPQAPIPPLSPEEWLAIFVDGDDPE